MFKSTYWKQRDLARCRLKNLTCVVHVVLFFENKEGQYSKDKFFSFFECYVSDSSIRHATIRLPNSDYFMVGNWVRVANWSPTASLRSSSLGKVSRGQYGWIRICSLQCSENLFRDSWRYFTLLSKFLLVSSSRRTPQIFSKLWKWLPDTIAFRFSAARFQISLNYCGLFMYTRRAIVIVLYSFIHLKILT